MEGIWGLTEKTNGNKWLPYELTNECTGLGIEPITADKHWHDMQFGCSPLTWPTFLFFLFPKQCWSIKIMHYAWTLCWGHGCSYILHAWVWICVCMCIHVPVCAVQWWWMESCAAPQGSLVSQRARAGHLGMMHHTRGWRPGQTLPTLCVYDCLQYFTCSFASVSMCMCQ